MDINNSDKNEILGAIGDLSEKTDTILEAVGHFSDKTESRFDKLENRLTGVENRLSKVETNMVTKDYLDEKLADLRGENLPSMEPFPQS